VQHLEKQLLRTMEMIASKKKRLLSSRQVHPPCARPQARCARTHTSVSYLRRAHILCRSTPIHVSTLPTHCRPHRQDSRRSDGGTARRRPTTHNAAAAARHGGRPCAARPRRQGAAADFSRRGRGAHRSWRSGGRRQGRLADGRTRSLHDPPPRARAVRPAAPARSTCMR
jgi:hypothetical protein